MPYLVSAAKQSGIIATKTKIAHIAKIRYGFFIVSYSTFTKLQIIAKYMIIFHFTKLHKITMC